MIDLQILNVNKTYVGWQIGQGAISKLIQKFSQNEAKKYNLKNVATHIFMLIYNKTTQEWEVIESHAKTRGVHKDTFEHWLKDYDINYIFCAECEFDLTRVQYYLDFNPGYSLTQIAKDAIEEIADKDLWNDSAGVVCSELFAICEKNFKTCYAFKQPTYQIKPVMVQAIYGG